MEVREITLENYRNIERATLSFTPGVNLLLGSNAQGKTNVLEGIYTFARGKSFRAAAEGDCIRFGQDGFSLSLRYAASDREGELCYRLWGRERRRTKNGSPCRLSEMMQSFHAVLFHPGHLQLVRGGPADRRDFLNIGIGQCNPLYIEEYAVYNRVLENRNRLLRALGRGEISDRGELEVWSASLARSAATLVRMRRAYLRRLGKYAAAVMEELSGGREHLTIDYLCSIPECEDGEAERMYLSLLTEKVEREIAAGFTLYGVHRDDLELKINGIPARGFASQGQQRSVVLALKMAEGEVTAELCGEYPVLLFDDVMSELDEERRAFVLRRATDRQMIITACERGEFERTACSVTEVREGKYVPSHR